MSQKRQQPEEGASSDDKGSRKSNSFRRVAMDVMNIQRLQKLMFPVLEPLVRKVVKEEVDSALTKYIISMKRNCEKDAHPSEMMRLQLQFTNAISLPVFTGTRIEGQGYSPVEVALVDVLSGNVVSNGVGSTARVEVAVLEGDFDGDDGDNWTREEFMSNMVREREGKKPLLTGDLILTLKDGTGSIRDISFTDNSSWTRSRKFRLGARIVDDVDGVRIREAKSEPFVVRDHRGELYKKHHPPHLLDDVWRLEKIGKDGALHKRLSKEGVSTVQDFLILLSLNPTRLRNILGSGTSSKKWEVTVEHARTCVLGKTLYLYGTSTSLPKDGVVFNAVGQVMGMVLNGHYMVTDKLSEEEKANAHELVICAYANRDNIVPLDESILSPPSSLCVSLDQLSSSPFPDCSTPQDLSSHKISTSNFPQMDTSSDIVDPFSTGGSTSFEYCVDPMDQPLSFASQTASTSYFGINSMPATAFCVNDQCFEDFYGVLNNSTTPSAPTEKAYKFWGVLVWVLRWRYSIRRILAKKSNRVSAEP